MAKINISIEDELLERIDQKRKEKKWTRSAFLRRSFNSYLQIMEEEELVEEERKTMARAVEVQDRIREQTGKWNAARVLRKFRDERK